MEPGIYSGIYNGKEILGFKKEHKYTFEIRHNGKTYQLRAFCDADTELEKDLYIDYSSSISIKKNWTLDKDKIDEINSNL